MTCIQSVIPSSSFATSPLQPSSPTRFDGHHDATLYQTSDTTPGCVAHFHQHCCLLTTPIASSSVRRSARTSLPASKVIPDSGEDDDDDDDSSLIPAPVVSPAPNTRRQRLAVVLPAMPASKKATPKVTLESATVSNASGSTRDESDGYDTPATSAANTPPTTFANRHPASILGKRRRAARSGLSKETAIPLDDAQLAAALQAEEYNGDNNHLAESDDADGSDHGNAFQEDSDLGVDYDYDSDDFYDSDIPSKKARTTRPRTRSTPKRKAGTSTTIGAAADDGEDDESPLSNLPSDFEDNDSLDGTDASQSVADAGDAPAPEQERRSLARHRRLFVRRDRTYVHKLTECQGRTGLSGRGLRERVKLEEQHPIIKAMWDEVEQLPKIEVARAPQPEGISRALKSFQLEGLHWMRKQEQTQWKGGLLGDEMGMGKTIQAVSLIMSDYPQKAPTLVAVPPVALMQWSNEIREYTSGKLKVLVYHGQNAAAKKMTVKQLKNYDVIMISYSGLESIYRKETKGWTRKDSVVKADSPIHAIKFHRLILDEAHSIKSRTTGVAKACFALQGTYKWCLSGTPVQNRIGEFFSLLRFLQISPFANYFCKSCPCSCLNWSASADFKCTHCGHRNLEHVSVFNQEILNPILQADEERFRKRAFKKLRILTDRIMLRRMKRDYTTSMELPPKEVVIHNEFFGPIESDFAGSIMNSTNRKFDTYVSRGVMLNNYANIFGLIMQMRQVADHPDLILRKHAEEGQNALVCNICDETAEDAIKSRCKHDFCRACAKDYIKSYEGNDENPGCPRCHIALSIDLEQPEIEQDEEVVKKNSIINRIKMENWTSSTKIEMLVYDLWKLRSRKQTTKSIVFSQFTSMLQLVEWRLRRAGFNTVLLDGSMTPAQRQKSIEHFMNNADVEVFLVSLKAGGVALNLTEASRVFIIDPWWNPAAEWQSADRCHRIGQRRPCVITRLVVEDSIESRIVMLQEKKAQMIQGTVNNDDVAMEKLTPQDMQFLFRGS